MIFLRIIKIIKDAAGLETELNAGLDGVDDSVIDMKDLVYLSSAGLRMILAAQKRMN